MVKYPQQLKLVVHIAYGPTWIDMGNKKKKKKLTDLWGFKRSGYRLNSSHEDKYQTMLFSERSKFKDNIESVILLGVP